MGYPNPREWSPTDEDWQLPDDWQKTVLEGMRGAAEKYRSFKVFMDICVRCGACADKCHFFMGSGDPKNMPVLRAELLRRSTATTSPPPGRSWASRVAAGSSPWTSSRSGTTTSTSAPSAAAVRSSAPTASTPPRSP